MKNKYIIGISVIVIIFISTFALMCYLNRDENSSGTDDEEPVILEEGSTTSDPGFFITDDGEVIYTDSRSGIDEGYETGHDPTLAAVFPGSARIHPSGENPNLRECYMTRAPYDAVIQFYMAYLERGVTDPNDVSDGSENIVNTIESYGDSDGRRVALYVNSGDGPRGGLKVMLNEYPSQNAIQIVLTTLAAIPPGLDPMGVWITPEEVEEWTAEHDAEQEELERRRREAEETAIDPPVAGEDSSSDDDTDSEEGAE